MRKKVSCCARPRPVALCQGADTYFAVDLKDGPKARPTTLTRANLRNRHTDVSPASRQARATRLAWDRTASSSCFENAGTKLGEVQRFKHLHQVTGTKDGPTPHWVPSSGLTSLETSSRLRGPEKRPSCRARAGGVRRGGRAPQPPAPRRSLPRGLRVLP